MPATAHDRTLLDAADRHRARARLSRLGRVVSLAIRPSGDWVTVDAALAIGARVTAVFATAPCLDAALAHVGA